MSRLSLLLAAIGWGVLCALWVGCSTPRLEVPPLPAPLEVPPDAPSITLKSFRSTIREGVVVGPADGALRWTGLTNRSDFEKAGRRELRALGFPGPEVEGDPFEADLAQARYWIAATLVHWEYEFYRVRARPMSAGRGRFLWQVYDTTTRQVRLEHTGEGYASVPELDALEHAFLDALRRFTATPAFAELIVPPDAEP